jgi:hypothetical protein
MTPAREEYDSRVLSLLAGRSPERLLRKSRVSHLTGIASAGAYSCHRNSSRDLHTGTNNSCADAEYAYQGCKLAVAPPVYLHLYIPSIAKPGRLLILSTKQSEAFPRGCYYALSRFSYLYRCYTRKTSRHNPAPCAAPLQIDLQEPSALSHRLSPFS